jgi:hypothetical protein
MLGTSGEGADHGCRRRGAVTSGWRRTCCGFTPFFQIKTGSSNTFIGGNRAARMLDICQACAQADDRNKGAIAAGKVMGALGSVARGIQKVQGAMGYVGLAMQAAEAAVEDDAALGPAMALAAAMDAAQMAPTWPRRRSRRRWEGPGGDPAEGDRGDRRRAAERHDRRLPDGQHPNPAEMLLKRLARYSARRAAGAGRGTRARAARRHSRST